MGGWKRGTFTARNISKSRQFFFRLYLYNNLWLPGLCLVLNLSNQIPHAKLNPYYWPICQQKTNLVLWFQKLGTVQNRWIFPSAPFHNTFLHYMFWPNWPTLNLSASIFCIVRGCEPHGPEAWAGFSHWWWFPHGRQHHSLNLVERKHNELLWSYVLNAWRLSTALQYILPASSGTPKQSPWGHNSFPHKTIHSASPPNLHQKYLWLHRAMPSGISLLLVCTEWKTEQSRICPWKDKRQANKCIHVHLTFNVGKKNCFQSDSHDSSCLNQQGKVYKGILVCDGTSSLKL